MRKWFEHDGNAFGKTPIYNHVVELAEELENEKARRKVYWYLDYLNCKAKEIRNNQYNDYIVKLIREDFARRIKRLQYQWSEALTSRLECITKAKLSQANTNVINNKHEQTRLSPDHTS